MPFHKHMQSIIVLSMRKVFQNNDCVHSIYGVYSLSYKTPSMYCNGNSGTLFLLRFGGGKVVFLLLLLEFGGGLMSCKHQ